MALTKESVIDKIEVLENGVIQVRTAISVLENDQLLSKSYHRHALQPGADLTEEDARVQAVASAVWTTL